MTCITQACAKRALNGVQVQFQGHGRPALIQLMRSTTVILAVFLGTVMLTLSEIDQFAEVDRLSTLVKISNRLSF